MNRMRPGILFGVATLAIASAGALETGLKPGMDKEREAMITKWKQTLALGDPSSTEQTLAEATAKASVAFGMSDWPQAVAETAAKSQPPLQDLLLNHLRQHRALLNQTTADWIRNLFKRDVLDPMGELVSVWAEKGAEGTAAAAAALKASADAKRWDELAGYLEASARRGNARFLPLASSYLNCENEHVSQAALGVFKAHAKDLGPDLRSPKLCQIWWLQSGRGLFEGQ